MQEFAQGEMKKAYMQHVHPRFHNFIKKHLNPNYPEGGSDFFLMDRSVVSEYLKIDVQYTGGLLIRYWMGYEQKEIPYVRKKREVGKSGFGFYERLVLQWN